MRTIWKFTLELANGIEHTLEIPGGGRFLSARDREVGPLNLPSLDTWWEVDDEKPKQAVRLQMVGTGNEVPENASYHLATFFPVEGYVLHLWRLSDE